MTEKLFELYFAWIDEEKGMFRVLFVLCVTKDENFHKFAFVIKVSFFLGQKNEFCSLTQLSIKPSGYFKMLFLFSREVPFTCSVFPHVYINFVYEVN